jgi:hypothetical protein
MDLSRLKVDHYFRVTLLKHNNQEMSCKLASVVSREPHRQFHFQNVGPEDGVSEPGHILLEDNYGVTWEVSGK